MTVKISNPTPPWPCIKSGNLVLVGGDVVLVTGDHFSPNFRGLRLSGDGAYIEAPFRICDAVNFTGTVTITNEQG